MSINLIPPVPGTRSIPFRQDFDGICNRDLDAKYANVLCRALVLQQFLHHVNVRLDSRSQSVRLNEAAVRAGIEPTQDTEACWVYLSQEDMYEELMGRFCSRAIREAYAWLTKVGWIAWRRHPKYRGDQTRQWTIQIREIRIALACWAAANGFSYELEIGELAGQQLGWELGPTPPKGRISTRSSDLHPTGSNDLLPSRSSDRHPIGSNDRLPIRSNDRNESESESSADSEKVNSSRGPAQSHVPTPGPAAAADSDEMADRPNRDAELIDILVSLDLNRVDAARFAEELPEVSRRQAEYVSLMDTEDFTNRGAYLRKAIEGDFGPTKKVREKLSQRASAAKRQELTERNQREAEERESKERDERERVDSLWSSLTDEERERIDAQAVERVREANSNARESLDKGRMSPMVKAMVVAERKSLLAEFDTERQG